MESVTDSLTQQAEQLCLQQPEVKDVSTEIRDNVARLRVRLVPRAERRLTTRELVEKLRPAISAFPQAYAHFQLEQRGESDNVVMLEVTGPLQETLIGLALEVRRRLQSSAPAPGRGHPPERSRPGNGN